MTTAAYSPGLEGVIAGETKLSFVNSDINSLMYRGYDIRDLVDKSTYEETAYLLIYGELPSKAQLAEFSDTLKKERGIPQQITDAFRTLPKQGAHPMDLLRAGVAMLCFYDAELTDNSHEANVRKAVRLTAKFPALITHSYRINQGQEPIESDNSLNHSENFLYTLLGKKPDPYFAKTFDATLICYADHGFNASTFAARVTTSTLSDMYSGVVSAIGALKGPLHGGANEEAMKMLIEIGSPDKAEAYIMDALAKKKKIMGFGHRAYKTGDPRAFILSEMAGKMSQQLGETKWHEIATIVESTIKREKNILPNVDFPTAYVYYMMGLPIEIYTPIFALSRVAGWTAHVIEQLDNNKLIRPKVLYEGDRNRPYTTLETR
ncbi:MAG: citrate/2-methylcitrate synthase [Vampirovibrionales bacterium]|nr:citrate/2-methylcitrate synthase [Vampirovibrionales bacterium]